MEMSETRKIEVVETSVETNVETVEIEEHQCAVCEQWYRDEDEMVALTLNATRRNAGVYGVEQICQRCAESLFDYQGPTYGTVDALRDEARRWTPEDVVQTFWGTLGKIVRFLLPLAITMFLLAKVMDAVSKNIEGNEAQFEQAAYEMNTTGATPLFDLVGVVIIVALLAVVIAHLTGGPRR